jgi:hypothetical protein
MGIHNKNHASEHTDGTDDIQDATSSQKGLATAAQAEKLDEITLSGDQIIIGGSNRLVVDKSYDNVAINTDNTLIDIESRTWETTLKVIPSTAVTLCSERYNTYGGPVILSARGRGTESVPVVVQDGDDIGKLIFAGYDGTDFEPAGHILFEIDGTPGNDDMPGRVIFATTSDGSDVPTERMRIDSAGDVGIGVTDMKSKLDVDGGVKIGNDTDTASADKVGTLRYRTSGNNSYLDVCMQTGASTYSWINIVQQNW